MKNCIFWGLFFLFLATPTFAAQQQNSNPTLVFYVDHEDEQQKDYVEITLQVEAKDTSLTSAIQSAAATVQQISALAKDFCNDNAKKKADCKEIVDAGKFNVEPRYQLIRKSPVFMGFTVTHEMTLSVKTVENIGYLVDNILTKPGITLKTFEWKALEEPKTHEEAVAEGMQEGQGLCQQLGLRLGRIISIEQLNEEQAAEEQQEGEDQEGGEDQEQEEDEEAEATVFKFEVECAEPSKKQ